MYSTSIRDGFGRSVDILNNSNVTRMAGLCAAVHHLKRCGALASLHAGLDSVLPDRGQKSKVKFKASELLELRIFALMAGSEDLNDFPDLARDPGFTMVFGKKDLPSTATLCRFERRISQKVIDRGNSFLLETFFKYCGNQRYLYIDVDNTPVELFGHQENVHYNGHYRCNCYLPLLAFINGYPVGVFNGHEDGRKTMAAQFRKMVETIRARRKDSIIILRADSGFNGRTLIDLCEELGCYYIIGLAPNSRLVKLLEDWEPEFVDVLRRPPQAGGSLLRHYGEIEDYQAQSWSSPRRVIVRDYWDDVRRQWDPRFVQTNIPKISDGRCGRLWRLSARELYANVYCECGRAEKFNQEFKVQAFGARASSTRFLSNSYRMLLGAICQLFFQILRKCFFNKRAKWNSVNLETFRSAFIKVPALLVLQKKRVKIHLNLSGVAEHDLRRFWTPLLL